MAGSYTTALRKRPRLQDPDPGLASPKSTSSPLLRVQSAGGNAASLGLISQTAGPMVQRQQTGQTPQQPAPAQAAPISAAAVFGLPVGSRVLLSGLVGSFVMGLLRDQAPDVAAALTAIGGKRATVSEATPDRFSAVLDEAVTLPGAGGGAARQITGLAVTLVRDASGAFDFTIAGQEGSNTVVLAARQGLQARQQGNAVVFVENGVDSLRITPAAGPQGEATIGAFTAPFAGQIPSGARFLVPDVVNLVSVARLPDAPRGSAEETRAVEAATRRAAQRSAGTAATPHVISAGAGLAYGPNYDVGFSASYRYNLSPVRAAGNLFQTPIEAQIFFTPSSSIIGTATGSAGLSLTDLQIPVTVRLITGVGGGRLSAGRDETGAVTSEPAFGPVLGGGAGLVLGSFRTEIQYQHLFNLVEGSTGRSQDFGALQLTLGRAF